MVDRYTKVTLTVIAFALCVLALENFKSAVAQNGPMPVMICNGDPHYEPGCAGVKSGVLFVGR